MTDDLDLDARAVATALRRRWWIALGVPLVALAASLATWRSPDVTYEARLRVAVDIPRSAIVEGSDEGTAAKIGEALVDDISRVVPSQAFAAAVAERLPEGVEVAPGQIASDLSASDRHRVADVWVRRTVPAGTAPAEVERSRAELQAVADAVVAELEANAGHWFARLGEDQVALTVLDRPRVAALPPTTRERIELPLRLAVGIALGVLLALAADAVDPRVHTADDAAAYTGAPVVGRVPRRGRRTSR